MLRGLRSARQLIAIASRTLAHRWYRGYHLDDPLPDHASVTRIRQRLGVAIVRCVVAHVVALWAEAGLVWGQDVVVDATTVPGNADVDSLVPRLTAVSDGQLVDLCGEQDGELAPDTEQGTPPRLLHPERADAADPDTSEPERWTIVEACRLDPDRPLSPGYVC